MKEYSILIPIHNEVNLIPLLLKSLTIFIKNGHQIIIIDDGSDDGSTNILESCLEIDLVCLNENMGKGSAIKEGLKRVVNKREILFDGDMENKGGWGAYYDLPSTISFFADAYNLDKRSKKVIAKKGEGSEYDIYLQRHWSQNSDEEVWMYEIVEGRHVWPGFKIHWWENPIFLISIRQFNIS